MTSPRSTSTHSASRSPSTPSGMAPRFLANLTTSSAIDFTWRVEVPEAITRWSATLVLPRTSISTTSLALISSTAARTAASSWSTEGGGSGSRGLRTCAWLLKEDSGVAGGKAGTGRLRGGLYRGQVAGPSWRPAGARAVGLGGAIQAMVEDVAGHRRRHHRLPLRIAGCDRRAHRGGGGRIERLPQREDAAIGGAGQRRRRIGPAPLPFGGQFRRQLAVDRLIAAAGHHQVRQRRQFAPPVAGRQRTEAVGAQQQGQRRIRAVQRAQFAQGVDGPRRA